LREINNRNFTEIFAFEPQYLLFSRIMKQKILIIALLFFSMVVAQDQEQSRRRSREDRVRFGGKANVGIDFRAIGGLGDREINDSRLNRIATVETELVVFPADNVRLEFDLEYDWRFTDVNLQKLFIRYDFDNSNARLGFMKKMFSWEEIKSGTDRLFIKKSMLNNILSDFFLLDRDFTIQYRYNFPSYTLIGGFSGDGSNRIFGNLTYSQGNSKEKGLWSPQCTIITRTKTARTTGKARFTVMSGWNSAATSIILKWRRFGAEIPKDTDI